MFGRPKTGAAVVFVSLFMLALFTLAAIPIHANEKDLLRAAKRGKIETVSTLLAQAVDPNAKDRKGRTPLMLASENGHLPVVRALLDSGANPTLTDRKSRTALSYATKAGEAVVVEQLRFALARRSDTAGAYISFLTDHPRSEFTPEIQELLHARRWADATEKNTTDAYQQFMANHPDSEHIGAAQAALETLAWQTLARKTKVSSSDYEAFLADYPTSAHAAAAREHVRVLKERESRMSLDGRFRVGEATTVSKQQMTDLLEQVNGLIQPLTLADLAGDNQEQAAQSGGISIGGGGFAMGTNSVQRENGVTVMTMSARSGADSRPANVGVWHLPPGQSALLTMFGGGSSGDIALRLFGPTEDARNPFRYKRVRTFDDKLEYEYVFNDGVWTLQRYEKSEQ